MPRLAPITWIDTWLRLATLAILLIVGLHNARPDALPGHDRIAQARAYIDATRTAIASRAPAIIRSDADPASRATIPAARGR